MSVGTFCIIKAHNMTGQVGNWGFVYHSSYSKVKVSNTTNFYNHTFNSRAAVVMLTEESE